MTVIATQLAKKQMVPTSVLVNQDLGEMEKTNVKVRNKTRLKTQNQFKKNQIYIYIFLFNLLLRSR